jgi:ActR/RegA family two-component response regulator
VIVPATRQPSRTLLIVDDETTILFAITRFFKARGFSIESAADLAGAVARLEQSCPDVVIIDLRLGGLGDTQGLDVLDRVRARCPNTRTLLLTAYGTRQVEVEARRRGADVVLHKPTPLVELAEEVTRLLAERADPGRGAEG